MEKPKFPDCIRIVNLRVGRIEFYKNYAFFIDWEEKWTEIDYHDLADMVWEHTDESDINDDKEVTEPDDMSAAKSYLEDRGMTYEV